MKFPSKSPKLMMIPVIIENPMKKQVICTGTSVFKKKTLAESAICLLVKTNFFSRIANEMHSWNTQHKLHFHTGNNQVTKHRHALETRHLHTQHMKIK